MRDNFSSYHAYEFDPRAGEPLGGLTHQGLHDESCWSCGQVWAIHGFAQAYLYTGVTDYRETAAKMADYVADHLPKDGVPLWDYDLPAEHTPYRDSSAGAGKSTLVNLLLRFFEAEKGTIAIDGQNIRDVDQDSLRFAIGMVAQQASLLNRSVRDNILLGREDVSEEALISAATQACAHPFILELCDKQGRSGYDAHVGERGIKLSGGQRQRVAIARVILKDAPILILDEATSALDSEVESEIQQSLVDIMQNKTVIAIAHRLSTIARMDRIIVMDQGKIVEKGTHSELVAQSGIYASFWSRQSDGFIDTSM